MDVNEVIDSILSALGVPEAISSDVRSDLVAIYNRYAADAPSGLFAGGIYWAENAGKIKDEIKRLIAKFGCIWK